MCRYRQSDWHRERFFVVDVPGPAIAGLPSSKALHLVTIHTNSQGPKLTDASGPIAAPGGHHTTQVRDIQDLKDRYPNQFDTLGDFKTPARLHLKPDAQPQIDPPQKCSVHVKPKLEAELHKMEKDGVIRRVSKHTDWCSSLTTVVKKDGSLRVCLDPKRLNESLKRCPHKIPTPQDKADSWELSTSHHRTY